MLDCFMQSRKKMNHESGCNIVFKRPAPRVESPTVYRCVRVQHEIKNALPLHCRAMKMHKIADTTMINVMPKYLMRCYTGFGCFSAPQGGCGRWCALGSLVV
jgi:hypothetical protein